jgi:two-component system osmolarity sensor histidine kinase EnvZ
MFNKLIPTSLFIRFILIIVVPIIFAQLIATYIFYNRHWESVSKNMSLSLSNEIQTVFTMEKQNISSEERHKIYSILGIKFDVKANKSAKKIKDLYPSEAEYLYTHLKEQFNVPLQIRFIDDDNNVQVKIYKDTQVFSFITNSKRIDNPTTYIFILWMTGTSIIFILLSIIFARNQIRPIIKLARAADRFGKGQQNIPLKPEGAKEIRKAATAFLKMKERIERQISSRTEMLAGISHDLRTPLTRMKLQLNMSPGEESKFMLEDVDDMENMINSYLDFTRGDSKEVTKQVSFSKFLDKVIAPYLNQKLNLSIKNAPNIKIPLKTDAIKRCFQNLLDNAFKYGSESIINSYLDDDNLCIEIHDNGPGIPENKFEEVFKPFFRLDESRNKETGGVGLGLAITKDIISNHGGQIYFATSKMLGGLKAVIKLPL